MPTRLNLKAEDHVHDPAKKKRFNEEHFRVAASRYDFATGAMSLGRDRFWKKRMVAALPALDRPDCLDLATGTGDIALLLAERFPGANIVGMDLCDSMLAIARRRNPHWNVRFVPGDMAATELPDASFDLITGSYAVRNAPIIDQAISEIHRLLKPGGCAAILDFAKSPSPPVQILQCRLLKTWCGLWGFILHGDPAIHAYIAASLETFPDREEFKNLLARKGLNLVAANTFYGGLLELIRVRKPSPQKA